MENESVLKFRISAGLKNILGKELIRDKFIAIFELVKNSYDAGAKRVDIRFDNINSDEAIIRVSDNGCGMDKNDMIHKWLFVAYSEKNKKVTGTYRDEYTKRAYAGAKGVGRISCDCLGSKLEIYSRKDVDKPVNLLSVDWAKFENDAREEFIDIPVSHSYADAFFDGRKKGTCIVIKELREKWNRTALLELKKYLSRLVNPHTSTESESDSFKIFLHCDSENAKDSKEKGKSKKVNGQIENYVFEALNLRTTHVSVTISEDGDEILTKMTDRGIVLFELNQKSKFTFLKNINIELFYLNRSAKLKFHNQMGLASAAFGSIMVYKNGFRVMPYGEPGSDTFKIDRRKQQGYNRFFGTRDLMGRISILGDNPDFVETSSRDGGFINARAFEELADFFKKFALFPLENYVVKLIAWGDPIGEGNKEIMPEDIATDIVKYITNYEKKGIVNSLRMGSSLIALVDERKNKQKATDINALKSIVKQYNNPSLDKLTDKLEKEHRELHKGTRLLADQLDKVTETLEHTESELKTTKKQALFLRNLANPHIENATKSMHTMKTSAESIALNVNNAINVANRINDSVLQEEIKRYLFDIAKAANNIKGTFNTALHAEYDIGLDDIKMNMTDFITQFVYDVFLPSVGEILKIKIVSSDKNCESTINPSEFSILIDNIVVNSYKARATNLLISISSYDKWIRIIFSDDGVGIHESVSDVSRLFEMGFTTTDGSGVGLAHIKTIVEKLNGNLQINNKARGFELEMRIKNEYKV